MQTIQQLAILIISTASEEAQRLNAMLNFKDYNVLICETNADAVNLCQINDVHLVILDAEYAPENAYLKTCELLVSAKLQRAPQMLILLEDGNENAIRAALSRGAADIMLKPIIPSLFAQRTNALLQSLQTSELQQALRQSEDRLNMIITHVPMILFTFDAQGIINFIAGYGLERIARTSDEFIGRSILTLNREQITTDARYVLETGAPYSSTIELDKFYFETWYNPILDASGKVISINGVAIDVTDREHASDSLQESLNFYLTFFEDFPVPVWRAGRNANLNYLNQSWLNFTGQSLEDTLANGWLDAIHPEDRGFFRETYLEHVRLRKPFEIEYRMRKHDGKYRHIVNLGKPFYELNGKLGGYIGLIYDVTERKVVEAQMVQLNFERERVTLLQEFISTVSHDLKTPLSSIMLYANLLRQTNTPEQRFQYTQIVVEQAKILQDLLDNMLEMSRLDEEITTLTFQRVNISKVLLDTAQFYSLAAQAGGLAFIMDIDPTMPRILANESELRRSLINLMDNAIKYTNEGSVTVKGYFEDNFVIIEVIDTGIGIAENDLVHVFDRFYRADQSRTMTGGTGLGLTIVKKIVEAHGGQILAESSPGKGTTFQVKLPTALTLVGQNHLI